MDESARNARAAAARLFASGMVDDPIVQAEGSVGIPLPIRAGDGSPAGWFVPLLAGELLCGFFQFDAALTFLRFSGFPHRPGTLDGCPAAASWLDPARVREVAETKFPRAAPAATPFLSYDRDLTRLAWAVPSRGGTIYVTGDYAYQANGTRDVTG